MNAPTSVSLAAAFLVALIALVCDLRRRRIPNSLTVSAGLVALLFHALWGWDSLLASLSGFAVGFGLLFALWLTGTGGAGDVKLMGALGAWLGPKSILTVFLGSAGVALLMMLACLLQSCLVRAMETSPSTAETADAPPVSSSRYVVPYAVPVAVTVSAMVGLRLLHFWS